MTDISGYLFLRAIAAHGNTSLLLQVFYSVHETSQK